MTGASRRAGVSSVALLALLAYLPSLASSPGRMPADTKLYLYLEPGELLGRAASTFEPDQFAGWVPHQQITYLWPSGPWFWLFDVIGTPDWLAHRLWIGTILFAAGTGAWWAARRIGLGAAAALVAAIVFQLSPYILAYVSRTSLLLLPWAALGWLIGLTVLACADSVQASSDEGSGGRRLRDRLLPWRAPALIALVVATVGSANATALALVAPGPVLWLIHAGWSRSIPWRRAMGIAARTALLSVAVSVWWVAMLVVQSRYGAPVLSYSETLADVSRNSTGSEVLRSLGYWLFYIRDPVAPTTTASLDYLVSSGAIAVSYAAALVGMVGLVAIAWPARRFAALLVAAGAVLAVGVHPIDDPAPLLDAVVADDGSGIALALRSSTRAVPLLALGLALGAGAAVGALPARRQSARRGLRWRPRAVGAVLVGTLALVNLPSLWGFDLVDPAIDRDEQPPDAWIDAAASLDDADARVLQLPGAEFGAFRWGYTVDQPLVALTDRPLVTRDLLPLGSAAAMDLLYALDDRVQEGRLEDASLAPVARLLAADTIWLANDSQFERFGTARPEPLLALVASAPAGSGLGDPVGFGSPVPNAPEVAMVDPEALADGTIGGAVPPVVLVPITDPSGIVRAKPASVLLSGSGDGIVDAAAAGVVTGREAVRYSASLDGEDLLRAADDAAIVVVTDSNRDRAHHWRGSQDVHGHTEPGGPDDDVLTPTAADQRLEVFPGSEPAQQTVAVQEGPVRAVASSYGEPFAYRPEDRAAMAVDGDPTTAWLVGGHGDPVGERIALTFDGVPSTLQLRQPVPPPGGRSIAAVDVEVAGADPARVELTEESFTAPGQPVEIPSADGDTTGTVEATTDVTVTIADVHDGDPSTVASRAGVGFVEIDAGLGPTIEYIRPPIDAVDAAVGAPLAFVLTRLRTEPTDPWRSDPEPELRRLLALGSPRDFDTSVELRLDQRASDDLLAELLAEAGVDDVPVASSRLTGAPRHAGMFALDGDAETSWITGFDAAVGSSLRIPLAGALDGEVRLRQPPGPYSRITTVTIGVEGIAPVRVDVPPPDADGWTTITLPQPLRGDSAMITVDAIAPATTVDRRYGDTLVLPAAIAEIDAPRIATTVIDGTATLELDCRSDLLELDGVPVALRATVTVDDLLDGAAVVAEVCDGPVTLDAGDHRLRSTARKSALTVDRVVMTDGSVPAGADLVPVDVTRDEPRHRTVTVEGCPEGCWLVLGEGYNEAWGARVDGESLGDPQLVDGGFNGWWLTPTSEAVTVDITWTAQRPVTIGLVVSSVAVLACVLFVVVATVGRSRRPLRRSDPELLRRPGRGVGWPEVLALVVASTVLIAPAWGVVALVVAAAAWLSRRFPAPLPNPIGWVGLGCAIATALAVVWIERRDAPLPNAGWTGAFANLHHLAVFSLLCIAIGACSSAAIRTGHSTTSGPP